MLLSQPETAQPEDHGACPLVMSAMACSAGDPPTAFENLAGSPRLRGDVSHVSSSRNGTIDTVGSAPSIRGNQSPSWHEDSRRQITTPVARTRAPPSARLFQSPADGLPSRMESTALRGSATRAVTGG